MTRHAYGLDTAWEATFEFGAGGPVVGFNSEMVCTTRSRICRLLKLTSYSRMPFLV